MPPVVSVTALAGLPALVRHAFGEKTLEHANRAALLDIETIEDLGCFIPYTTVAAFLSAIARRSGERDLGILFAPHLSFTNYGAWSDYVLSADTLGDAIERAIVTIGFHGHGDQMGFSVANDVACVSYRSAAQGIEGYVHIATGTACVLLSLLRSYTSPDWRPLKIQLDVGRPSSSAIYEDAFGCPVTYEAARISIAFHTVDLSCRRGRVTGSRILTIEDLSRERVSATSLHSFRGVIEAHIRAQVLSGAVSENSTALTLGISVRSLQRALDREGQTFRGLTNVVRMGRAKELLIGTKMSVTEISTILGYSSPANFARAFHQHIGVAPRAFRAPHPPHLPPHAPSLLHPTGTRST